MKKITTKTLATSAIIAALYVALTLLFNPISFGPIQFRISEILILLVLINPKYCYSLVIGCLVANLASPYGWYDIVFGTFATLISVVLMVRVKNVFLSVLFPVFFNAIIVSLEIFLMYNEAHLILYNIATIGLGEALVLYCLGIPVYQLLIRNKAICELLDYHKE